MTALERGMRNTHLLARPESGDDGHRAITADLTATSVS
jgi:hypothetical protein